MQMRNQITRVLLLLTCGITSATAQDVFTQGDEAYTPLLADVAAVPFAVPTSAGYHIAYELRIVNWHTKPIRLERIDVWGDTRLSRLEGDALESAMIQGAPEAQAVPVRIAPGRAAVALVIFSVNEPPGALFHRLSVRIGDETRSRVVPSAPTSVRDDIVNLAGPVRGGLWVAGYGLTNESHHRRSLAVWEGQLKVPQRYAIDFFKINPSGKSHRGDGAVNSDYLCYGSEAVAVADALVVHVKDGIPDNAPRGEKAVEITLDTIAGNAVVLRMEGGRHVTYGHLQPGTIPVEPGDRVKAGQLLGRVGNSGSSYEPHLHFQVNQDVHMFRSEGQPYTFESFAIVGRDGPTSHRNIMPLDSQVLLFE